MVRIHIRIPLVVAVLMDDKFTGAINIEVLGGIPNRHENSGLIPGRTIGLWFTAIGSKVVLVSPLNGIVVCRECSRFCPGLYLDADFKSAKQYRCRPSGENFI